MKILVVILVISLSICSICVAKPSGQAQWAVQSNPYRVHLNLSQAIDRKTTLAVDPRAVIEKVQQIAIDQVSYHTLAFERSVLVNPNTGKTVGRFKLVRIGKPFDIDGALANVENVGKPWYGFNKNKMELKPVTLDGKQYRALFIEEDQITNVKLSQEVQFEGGKSYLLEYWTMMEPIDNQLNVMVSDPEHRLFSQVPYSYYNKMPPLGEWAYRSVLFHERTESPDGRSLLGPNKRLLEITHAFVGRGAVAGLRLQEVDWRLVVEPDAPTDALDLYLLARAGHRLTTSPADFLDARPPRNLALAELGDAELQPLNTGGIKVQADGVAVWTVNPTLPLKVGLLERYQPVETTVNAAQMSVFSGGSVSLVVAVDAGTPRLDDLVANTNLPADVTFHRVATIPVYDGPTVDGQVKGKYIETRYDAMVPLDYKLDPDSEDGLHVVVATITPNSNTPTGTTAGQVTLNFAGKRIAIPVELRVSALKIAPKQHFGSIVGVNSFYLRPRAGLADMAEDGISMAEYHGLDHSSSEMPEQSRKIIRQYNHILLDNHLSPQSPGLGLPRPINYKIVDQGPGRAPQLTDWYFSSEFEGAIKEFVIDRGSKWFMVGRSNGHLMSHIRLINAKIYSYKANPSDPNWVQLPPDEYYKLIGGYWDGMAQRLDKLGILDRLVFVVDESQHYTYDDIYNYVKAMKSRPYAKHIKVGHTIQKPSAWTRKLSNGELMMQAIFDMPMPENDDHFNFFEHEWNARVKRDDIIQWVYNVSTDHINLEHAGLSSAFLPLKLEHLGVKGWYIWDLAIWSLPYAYYEGKYGNPEYKSGPVSNPWKNPFYHHGPGVLSHFYPPDPRGPAPEPTNLIIPSYRLTLMRDGIQERALLEVLRAGRDDEGNVFDVDKQSLQQAEVHLKKLWPNNPVQWYLDYSDYHTARQMLFDMAMQCTPRNQ